MGSTSPFLSLTLILIHSPAYSNRTAPPSPSLRDALPLLSLLSGTSKIIDPFGTIHSTEVSQPPPLLCANLAEKSMKIFGIGLSRSGAMTLNKALEALGYRSLFVLDYEQLECNLTEYDAFTHTPLAAIYKELDGRFPHSKFILNIREREGWLRSVERQWETIDTNDLSEFSRQIRLRVYGIDHFDRNALGRAYDQHVDNVSQHFKDRDQSLLLFDICGGEGFEKLCPFLGKPIPTQPFPHHNSARDTFERPSQKIKQFLIRHLKARKIKQWLACILRR